MSLKRTLTLAGFGFVIFYLFTYPAGAADAVNGAFDLVVAAADKLAIFVSKISL